MIKFILIVVLTLSFIEIILFVLIISLKNRIPWIITEEDEFPFFKTKKINKFIKKTYDKNLGWNWKPKTIHYEEIYNQKNKINFGKYGERIGSKYNNKQNTINFASFGDSFVFCRFVKNNETWQEQLNNNNFKFGLNYGVGNYGLDQIYLKYLKTKIPKKTKTIFIGFVPETLSRCMCIWKHYHEFKNIYGFKPKFLVVKNKLKLIANPIKNKQSFSNINQLILKIKKNEFFYKEKFLKRKLKFPYTLSISRNFNFNIKLILYSILKILKKNSNKIYDLIINENCEKNDRYFLKKKNTEVISKLIDEILSVGKKRNHKIVFLIFPQKSDLELKNKNYRKFFYKYKKKINLIDLTDIFKSKNLQKIYLPSRYGGHLTNYGNKLVAETIIKKVKFKW